MLTDEQCDEFRRLPCPFNDMVRAIYRAGQRHADPVMIERNEDGSLDDYCGPTGFRMEDMGGYFWALDAGRYRFHIEAVKKGQVKVTLFDEGATP